MLSSTWELNTKKNITATKNEAIGKHWRSVYRRKTRKLHRSSNKMVHDCLAHYLHRIHMYQTDKCVCATTQTWSSRTLSSAAQQTKGIVSMYYRKCKIRKNMLTTNPLQGEVQCWPIWGRWRKREENHTSEP